MKTGIEIIQEAYSKQISGEIKNGDKYNLGQMAGAAAIYALNACGFENPHTIEAKRFPVTHKVRIWPWADSYWEPSENPVRDLAKAGAFIAAEIDRINLSMKNNNE